MESNDLDSAITQFIGNVCLIKKTYNSFFAEATTVVPKADNISMDDNVVDAPLVNGDHPKLAGCP